jgi:hypothetical protein
MSADLFDKELPLPFADARVRTSWIVRMTSTIPIATATIMTKVLIAMKASVTGAPAATTTSAT